MSSREKKVSVYSNAWNVIEPKFNKALLTQGLIPLNTDALYFIHNFGCEGWFNVDRNQIHVSTTENTLSSTTESIMHELLHLVTYKPNMSYQEREDLVE